MTDRVWQEPDNGLDHAVARFGGKRSEWLDLSTGINPVPYPAPQLPAGHVDGPSRSSRDCPIGRICPPVLERAWKVP